MAYQRNDLVKHHVYVGALVALLTISPVIIYNITLFQTFGHFDFQLSHLFGQSVPYWQSAPGKEIGSMTERFANIFQNFRHFNSPVFNILAIGGVVFLVYTFMQRKKKLYTDAHTLLALVIGTNVLLYLATGPAVRFLTMIVPWLALAIAVGFDHAFIRARNTSQILLPMTHYALRIAIPLLLLWEGLYAINSYILYRPYGSEVAHYSRIHWDMHPYGFNELDMYVASLYAGAYPALTIPYNLHFLEAIKDGAVAQAQRAGREPKKILTIYNDNMDGLAALWILPKRSLYESWPIITVGSYTSTLETEGASFYRDAGFTDFYFIQNTETVLLNPPERLTGAGDTLENDLIAHDGDPFELKNHDGKTAFLVYYFE